MSGRVGLPRRRRGRTAGRPVRPDAGRPARRGQRRVAAGCRAPAATPLMPVKSGRTPTRRACNGPVAGGGSADLAGLAGTRPVSGTEAPALGLLLVVERTPR